MEPMRYKRFLLVIVGVVAIGPVGLNTVWAHAASQLGGPEYTCMGAIVAGNKAGVAKYTRKWFKDWPGLTKESGYMPGPYAEEEPLFKITAANYKQYAKHLTTGQEALFAHYPKEFYMLVYQSHRDFRMPEWRCKAAKYNFKHSRLTHNGKAITGHGGAVPFPFPDNGLQAVWNTIRAVHAFSAEVTYDIADVFGQGNITWGRAHFKMYAPPDSSSYSDKIAGYFFMEYLRPASHEGQVAVGFQPNNFATSTTQAWVYLPGLRRVKKMPKVGFDTPIPPSGFRTSDSDYIFNGSPELYNWKLVGRKTIYVPYNNFRINSRSISYDELLLTHTINPKYVRYEPHRVWIIKGTLKPDRRHIYQKRVLYVDEDTWVALLGDNYDQQGELVRVNMITMFYSQESGTYHRGVSVYRDLSSGFYEATYLVNERTPEQWWTLNQPMRRAEFSPQAAMRAGR